MDAYRTSSNAANAASSSNPNSLFVETSHFDDLALISSFVDSPKLAPQAPFHYGNNKGKGKVTLGMQKDPEPKALLSHIRIEDSAATNSEDEVEEVLSTPARSTTRAK